MDTAGSKKTFSIGSSGMPSAFNSEDVPYEVKEIICFEHVKRSPELLEPQRKSTDQGFLIGLWYAGFEEPRSMGSWQIAQLMGKNVAAGKAGKTVQANQIKKTDKPQTRFVKNWEELDTDFPAFDSYAEYPEISATTGRPMAQGEHGLGLAGTGGMVDYERMWADLGNLITDQEEGIYSPAVFAMTNGAIDERLNAGLQTFWNVHIGINGPTLMWNMGKGSQNIDIGYGYMWWEGEKVATVCNRKDFGPFSPGTPGKGVDKHHHARNVDDEDIISLHFNLEKAFWENGQRIDAPFLHEGEYQVRGGEYETICKVKFGYLDELKHDFLGGTADGRQFWFSFAPISQGSPPIKTPKIVIDPPHDPSWNPRKTQDNIKRFTPTNIDDENPGVSLPGSINREGQRNGKEKVKSEVDPNPYGDISKLGQDIYNQKWYKSTGINGSSPVKLDSIHKFNTRESYLNVAFPCVQLKGQIPNKYYGEEGWDFAGIAVKDINSNNERWQANIANNTSLLYQDKNYQISEHADYIKSAYYKIHDNDRPNICCIDGIAEYSGDKFSYTNHPQNANFALKSGTANGIVTVSPGDKSNHWDSEGIILSTLHWGYYKTVAMGWFNAVDNNASMIDIDSVFFIPDEVGGELNLDLYFYNTSGQRAGILTIHGETISDGIKNTAEEVYAVTTLNADTALDATHHIVLADTSGGNVMLTLPLANTCKGREYRVKKYDAANAMILNADDGDSIEGSEGIVLTALYDWNIIVSDGANTWLLFGSW